MLNFIRKINPHTVYRKFLGILLFLSFVAPAATTYLYLQYQKEKVKEEVLSQMVVGMNRDALVLLKFTKEQEENELDWEHSKEFEYRGQMYDIVETEVKGDTTYYLCWEDKKESRLKKKISKLVAETLGHNPKNRENDKRLQSFFKSLYYAPTDEIMALPFREMKMHYHFTPDFFNPLSQSPPAPPPDAA